MPLSRLVEDLSGWLHPTPSAVEFQQALDRDLSDQTAVERRLAQRREELLRRYNVDSIDALPVSVSGISLQEGEEHGNEVFDRHYGRIFDIYDAQNRSFQWAGIVAPMLPMRSLSMAMAGTDFAHHRRFVTAAEEYRRSIQVVMNTDIAANAKPGGGVHRWSGALGAGA